MAQKVRFVDSVSVSAFGNTGPTSVISASAEREGTKSVIKFTQANGNNFTVPIVASASAFDAVVSASVNLNQITFERGDETTFSIIVDTGSLSNETFIRSLTAAGISGSFNIVSSSFSTRVSANETNININSSNFTTLNTKTLLSSSAQISTEITGAFFTPSSSFSTRVSTLEVSDSGLTSKTLVSSSAQIANDISGSFTAVSSSFGTRVSTLEAADSGLISKTLVSSSAQIANDISGSFIAASSSFSTRVTSNEATVAKTLISSSVQIATEITGAFFTPSSSFSTRVSTLEAADSGLISKTLVSSSAQIANDISGSFTAVSSSFSTRVSANEIVTSKTLISSSAQISTEITGAFFTPSSSFSTRVSTLEAADSGLISKTLISSSAQISGDISGSFTAASSSFSTRVTSNEATVAKTLISSSVQIATEITGAFFSPSSSFSTRVSTLEAADSGLISKTLISSSAQIANDISGSFIAASSSFSTRVTANETVTAKTLISSSSQISTEITGAFFSPSSSFSTRVTNLKTDSGSFSTRVTTLEAGTSFTAAGISGAFAEPSSSFSTRVSSLEGGSGLKSGILSSSAQIAGDISGSFTAPSSSISTRLASLEAGGGSDFTPAGISGSFTEVSSSLSARIGTNETNITSITSSLDADRVVFTTANGQLATDAGMVYDSSTDKLTVTSLNVVHLTSSFITASSIQTSGSNIFGDDTTDTQTLIGTTKITGSAQITGSLSVTSGNISGSFIGNGSGLTNLPQNFTAAGISGSWQSQGFISASQVEPNLPTGTLSSSAQIATEITGAFSSASSSFSTRVTNNETNITTNTTDITSLTAVTGSYATTGSNNFIGDQNITGHITASGNISSSGKFIGTTGSFERVELGKSGTLNGSIKFNTLHGPSYELIANNNSLRVTGTTGAPDQGFVLDSQVENLSLVGGGSIFVQRGTTTGSSNGGGLHVEAQGFNQSNGKKGIFSTDATGPYIGNSSYGGTGTHGTFRIINGLSSDNDADSGSFTSAEFGDYIKFNLPITASGDISASGALLFSSSLSDNTSLKTLVYDTSTGKIFHTGSYAGGGGGGGGDFTAAGISGSWQSQGFISGSQVTPNLPTGTLSSSAQIANDISGSFIAASSSFSTRVTLNEATVAKTLISSSAQIAGDISGSFTEVSSSLAGRLTEGNENISTWTLGEDGTDSHYTFTGPGLTGAENDPDIYLVRGQKYRFYNNSGGHPFRIQSTPNGSAGTQYNDGVTNNDAGNGTYLLFDVQFDAPTKLYYQCTSHGYMGGPIYIADAAESASLSTRITTNETNITNLTAETGSYVQFPFNGDAVITGSLEVSGSSNSRLVVNYDTNYDTFINGRLYLGGDDVLPRINFGSTNAATTLARGAGTSITAFQWTFDNSLTSIDHPGSFLRIYGSGSSFERGLNITQSNATKALGVSGSVEIVGPITASGNISASGDITASGLNLNSAGASNATIVNDGTSNFNGFQLQFSGQEPKAGLLANYNSGEIRIGSINTTGTYFTTLFVNNSEVARLTNSTTKISSSLIASGSDHIIRGPLTIEDQITGSLTVESSGSTILDVQGSQGQLFTVDDDLLHDIFLATDISGEVLLKVSGSGLVEIPEGNLIVSKKLEVQSGSSISGSVRIEASGSTLFEVIGSEGTIFSLEDGLSGSLFSVGDISGLPQFEIFSDGKIVGDEGVATLRTQRPMVTHTTDFNITSSLDFAGKYHIVGGNLTCSIDTGSLIPLGSELEFFQTSSTNNFLFETASHVDLIVKNNNLNLAGRGSGATLKYIAGSTFHLVGDLT